MQQRQGASTHAQNNNASRIDAHDDARENSELASRCLELRSQVQKLFFFLILSFFWTKKERKKEQQTGELLSRVAFTGTYTFFNFDSPLFFFARGSRCLVLRSQVKKCVRSGIKPISPQKRPISTHCNTLQLPATQRVGESHCLKLQSQVDILFVFDSLFVFVGWRGLVSLGAGCCGGGGSKVSSHSSLQHTATLCSTLQLPATHCSTLRPTATQCKILQHLCNRLNPA